MRPLTQDEEKACIAVGIKAGRFSYNAEDLRATLLLLEGIPFETRVEADIRRDIKRLTEMLNYLANRRKERPNEQAA